MKNILPEDVPLTDDRLFNNAVQDKSKALKFLCRLAIVIRAGI